MLDRVNLRFQILKQELLYRQSTMGDGRYLVISYPQRMETGALADCCVQPITPC